MPYRTNSDIPKVVRDRLPEKAQSIFRRAFNDALKSGDEAYAFRIGWAAVSRSYKVDGNGKWIEKAGPASTPAPPEDRIFGSDQNRRSSASGSRGGINISEAIETSLRSKIESHNEKYSGKSQRANLGQLKAVYRRGAGAFSVSHRPGMTRNQWAMGRVNAFLYLLANGRPEKSSYITDNDLLPEEHERSTMKKAETYKPTEAMAANARRALRIRDSKPKSQRGMTLVGLARANQLINKEPLSIDTVRRMKAYFDRHQIDKQGSTWESYGKGRQAWDGWGGDEGWEWAKRIIERVDSVSKSESVDYSVNVQIEKRDDEQRMIFGWLYKSALPNGQRVVDHSGETISNVELEKAAYNFVLDSRQAGNMHQKMGVGRLVESVVFTPEKRTALGIPEGILPDGMWVGFKIDDDDTWASVKSGKLAMMSLGGTAMRRKLDE